MLLCKRNQVYSALNSNIMGKRKASIWCKLSSSRKVIHLVNISYIFSGEPIFVSTVCFLTYMYQKVLYSQRHIPSFKSKALLTDDDRNILTVAFFVCVCVFLFPLASVMVNSCWFIQVMSSHSVILLALFLSRL